MATITVFTEFSANGQLKKSAIELLTAARGSGNKIHAIALGSGAGQLAAQLGQHGVDEAFLGDHAAFDQYNPEVFTAAVAQILEANKPAIVLASSSLLGRDLFPRVAARLKTGIASDCTELSIQGDTLTVRRPMYAGKCTAAADMSKSPIKIALMRANQLPTGAPAGSKNVQVHTVAAPSLELKTLVKQVVKGASEKLDLTEANIIVSGGRGMRDADSFKLLHDLAEVLGATVGASRAVVDAGWVPHGMQVGQTGKTVAPTLYIACGISGAIQHLAGMSGSKVIVAINKDANAPIFQKATYGIVGDVFEVLPVLTAEFKKLLH
ncbi:MAG: electron transfer flavoprotein subunit alpha/FixB family protein [Bdellovibrionaceae bacterium]|nr:electron transfer flavoprotein subunit alpha/FixB family protein [Pseudobdellovibrionaceae bacterium]